MVQKFGYFRGCNNTITFISDFKKYTKLYIIIIIIYRILYITWNSNIIDLILWGRCVRNVLPTRSFGEHDVIRVLVRITFDELNTREIFPMSHGLFEQRFVRSAEAAVDLVRYYAEIPYPFFSCRCRSTSSRVDNVPRDKQII